MSNAVKATSWFQRFYPAYTLTGGPPVISMEVMAASQDLKVGDPVTKSAGVISKGEATSGAIYGVCLADMETTADDEGYEVPVAVATRNTVFCGQCDAASNGIADLAECDIIASGNAWLIDIGASTEDVVHVIKHVPGDDITDATDYGRLYFVWKRSQYDGLVAAR